MIVLLNHFYPVCHECNEFNNTAAFAVDMLPVFVCVRNHYSWNDIWLYLSVGCAAGSWRVTDYSANNTLFWGKLFKLFTSSNWLAEWGLDWVSSHCNVRWRILEQLAEMDLVSNNLVFNSNTKSWSCSIQPWQRSTHNAYVRLVSIEVSQPFSV